MNFLLMKNMWVILRKRGWLLKRPRGCIKLNNIWHRKKTIQWKLPQLCLKKICMETQLKKKRV